jgi:hypothetical protein
MKTLLKIEEFFLFGLALFLFSGLDYGWGAARYALLFFAPDLSMFGYMANPRVGSWTYNLVHHKDVLGYSSFAEISTWYMP